MFDVETSLHEFSMSRPVFTDEDFLRLIDLCPFLASEKSQYDDDAVLRLLKQFPHAACIKHSYRCGIGSTYPLALVASLGGSLKVIELMVLACPDALEEKLSGRRSILHYAIAEGVDVEIIKYLTSQNPNLVREIDSFQAIPLHLAASYPSSSPSVLHHLLQMYPEGTKCMDHKSQMPLHRACRSRATLEKIKALIEAYPLALFHNDWIKTTPIEWAERMDHRLSEPEPETVEIVGMMEEILTLGTPNEGNDIGEERDSECHRAQQILAHFKTIEWRGGIRVTFTSNTKLVPLLNIPTELQPKLLSLLSIHTSEEPEAKESDLKLGLESVFSILVHCPDVLGNANKNNNNISKRC